MFVEAILLYPAAASSWFRPLWPLTTGILVVVYAWGLALGFVQPAGIAAMTLLALLYGRTPGGTRGVLLHAVRWAPKLPDGLSLWTLNNALSVAFAEGALFRGSLQASLTRWLGGHAREAWISIGAALLTFGIAHYAAGPLMVVFASVAGVAYGLA